MGFEILFTQGPSTRHSNASSPSPPPNRRFKPALPPSHVRPHPLTCPSSPPHPYAISHFQREKPKPPQKKTQSSLFISLLLTRGVTWDLKLQTEPNSLTSMWRRLLSSQLKTLAAAATAAPTRSASLPTRSLISPSASLSSLRYFSVDTGNHRNQISPPPSQIYIHVCVCIVVCVIMSICLVM